MCAAVFGPASPPRMIGGRAAARASATPNWVRSCTCSPSKEASSFVHSCFIASRFSRRIARRSVQAVPCWAISSLFQPYPTPNRNRPFDKASRLATSLAVSMGSRCATRQMPVANLSVVVTAAHAPNATNGSNVRQQNSGSGGAPSRPPHGVARRVGMWECSANQSDSKPRVSTSRASSMAPIVWSVGKISTPMCMAVDRTRVLVPSVGPKGRKSLGSGRSALQGCGATPHDDWSHA